MKRLTIDHDLSNPLELVLATTVKQVIVAQGRAQIDSIFPDKGLLIPDTDTSLQTIATTTFQRLQTEAKSILAEFKGVASGVFPSRGAAETMAELTGIANKILEEELARRKEN